MEIQWSARGSDARHLTRPGAFQESVKNQDSDKNQGGLFMRIALTTFVAAAAISVLAQPANSQDKATFRFADTQPLASTYSIEGVQFFIKRLQAETDGKVEVQHFPNGQLGARTAALDILGSGAADFVELVPAVLSSKMPLHSVVDLPGMYANACEGVNAWWKLASEGILASGELNKLNIRPVYAYVSPAYQVWTAQKQVRKLEDLKGLKLRTLGGDQAKLANSLGAVPVNVSANELYEAVTRGTVDGILFPIAAMFGRDLQSHIKYGVADQSFGNGLVLFGMNLRKWNSLPEDVKTAINKAGEETRLNLCQKLDEESARLLASPEFAHATLTMLEPAEVERLSKLYDEVAENWKAGADARGLAGTAALEEFRAALAP